MRGTDNADTLVGTGDNDSIYGAGGNDLISGQGGTDVLVGQDGDDTLYGGDGNDYLVGGSGNDVLFGGEGVDWADYADATLSVNIDLASEKAQDTHGAGVDTLISIERVYGSGFDDVISGSKYDNLLSGGDGADTLTGNGGRDSLIGGGGNDVLIGGAGRDYLEGGLGDDTYVIGGKSDMVVEADGCGIDTVASTVSFHLGANIENLSLSGTGKLDGWGNTLNNAITGGEGANHLYGGGGIDTLFGGAGADTLEATLSSLDGGLGDDVLIGSGTLNGGDGDDSLTVTGRADVSGGIGTDWLRFDGASAGLAINLNTVAYQNTTLGALRVVGIENVEGSKFGDNIVGSALANLLDGGAGNDTLQGVGSGDTLLGGTGDDTLSNFIGGTVNGGGGSDTAVFDANGTSGGVGVQVDLRDKHAQDIGQGRMVTLSGVENVQGTAFDDTFTASRAHNLLAGGDGADTFKFQSLGDLNGDTITDYGSGDQIDISGIDADVNTAGDQYFHLTGSFTGGAGQARITYDAAHNLTYIDLDVNGDKVSDATLTLTGDHQSGLSFVL